MKKKKYEVDLDFATPDTNPEFNIESEIRSSDTIQIPNVEFDDVYDDEILKAEKNTNDEELNEYSGQ